MERPFFAIAGEITFLRPAARSPVFERSRDVSREDSK